VDAQRALEAGARACLFKPLTRLETLLEAIQAVLAPPP
jgi:CheY-like chemotaxis protein